MIRYSDQASHADIVFFFNDTATTEIYTLSLHDALPISDGEERRAWRMVGYMPAEEFRDHATQAFR